MRAEQKGAWADKLALGSSHQLFVCEAIKYRPLLLGFSDRLCASALRVRVMILLGIKL